MKLIPELRFPEFVKEGEWAEKPLKNLAKITMGSSPKSASYNENKIGLPLLQGNADIKDRLSAPRIYTSEITKECEIGDILLSVRAPVGTVAKSIHHACIGRGISGIRAENNNSQEFLYQWLFSFESAWKNISQGGTFDAVNSDDIRNLKVPIPEAQEQQKIASCLSSLDELIAAHNDKLNALKDHKKGLLQNLFPQEGETVPKLRFPEFEGDGEWVEKKLGKIAENLDSKRTPITSNQRVKGEIPYYGASGIIDYVKDYIFDEDLLLISEDGANLVARVYPIAFSISGKTWVNNHAHVLKFENWFTQVLVEMYLNSKNIEDFLTGMAQPKLNRKKLDIIPIPLPKNPEEQQKIASCLSAVDELITAQQEKIKQLQQHKKGLMQGLFPKIER